MVDRLDENASAAEIARWMGEDFGESLADGIEAQSWAPTATDEHSR